MGRKQKYSQLSNKELTDLYLHSSLTLKEISEKAEISITAILNRLAKLAVPLKGSTKSGKLGKCSTLSQKDLKGLFLSGQSPAKIGAIAGLGRKAIQRRLNKLGFKIPYPTRTKVSHLEE